ncbi:MAG: transposase [Erysipelotrichaceae bacterium]|nr:transposase [Erysipelotrichaceae bacterium]
MSVQNKYYSTIKKLGKKDRCDLSREELILLDDAKKHYYVLKKFHCLLLSNDGDNKVSDPNIEKKFNRVLNGYNNYYDLYDYMVKDDPELDMAYDLKYEVTEFYRKCRYDNAKQCLEEIIIDFRSCPVESMSKFANTLSVWKNEIIASFMIIDNTGKKMNTAIVENRNKTIKLIKHSSNGFLNWSRFRNKCYTP